jgi:hypothetical protein
MNPRFFFSASVAALLVSSAAAPTAGSPDHSARAAVECGHGKALKADETPKSDFALVLTSARILGHASGKKLRVIKGDHTANDPALHKWLAGPGKDPTLRRTLFVTLPKTEQEPERRYSFQECFPVHFKPSKPSRGGSSHHTEVTVKVSHLDPA